MAAAAAVRVAEPAIIESTHHVMNTSSGFPTSYAEFCDLITQRCGTALTRAYCQERIAALKDSSIPATSDFVKAYGEPHCRQVIAWYEHASREALA
jgi:hypothetical protein